MITLTETAAEHIVQILKRHKNSLGFRLSIKKTGCSGYQYVPSVMTNDNQQDDRVETAQGLTVFIDRQWLSILSGTVIDLVLGDLGQKKLIYNNPNVENECGCGESFALKENGNKK